jgi:hypothetical protein
MKNRIAIWAGVGFLVAGAWAFYALAMKPEAMTFSDPIMPLVRLTCPIALLSFYPIRLYWALLANAATYALASLVVEALRQRLHPAR